MGKNSKGFASILVVILVVLAVTGYFVYKNYKTTLQPSINVGTVSPTSTPQLKTTTQLGWKEYKNTELGIEFDYPSYKTIFVDKLGSFNFLTNIIQDGTSIDLANNGGGQIDIYNNPNNISLTEALKLQDKNRKVTTVAPEKTIQIAGANAIVRYEDWGPGGETVVVHFAHKDKYVVASRGVASFDPKETVQMAENELLGILKTFKFTN